MTRAVPHHASSPRSNTRYGNRDLGYERDNVGYDEQYPDGDGIKCKNYIVCKEVLPSWWHSCKSSYLCTNCDMMFTSELPIIEEAECPICFETGTGVTQPRCDHHVCPTCFRRCYYGPPTVCPAFPYDQHVEDQYLEGGPSDEWYATYPLVLEYEAQLEANEYASEQAKLPFCPLCRK